MALEIAFNCSRAIDRFKDITQSRIVVPMHPKEFISWWKGPNFNTIFLKEHSFGSAIVIINDFH